MAYMIYDIESCTSSCDDIKYVLIGGDFNTDLSRYNSTHTIAVGDFCQRNDLNVCLDLSVVEVDFIHESLVWYQIHP